MDTGKYNNAAFIRIPKTASTSVTKKLNDNSSFKYISPFGLEKISKIFNNEGYWIFGHHDFKDLYKKEYINENFFKNSFKFVFVRNPYTRMVSLYHHLMDEKGYSFKDFKSFCKKIQKGVKPIDSASSYNFHKNNNGLIHCNPQHKWVFPEMNYVGKTENIDKDFKEICSYLDIEYLGKLPKHRYKGIKNYDKYYDRETRDIVNSIYEMDFKKFDYKMK